MLLVLSIIIICVEYLFEGNVYFEWLLFLYLGVDIFFKMMINVFLCSIDIF